MTELRNVILVVWLALGLCACSNPEADRALIEAAKGGNLEQVNLAISDWGNVNAKGGKLMATPLHYATVHGHTPVVERLLDKGADVGLTDANGETPLHDAATFGNDPEAITCFRMHKLPVRIGRGLLRESHRRPPKQRGVALNGLAPG